MIGIIRNGYTLKLQNFEGPLELLLELIGESRLDVSEILLSEVTDQYLNYIRTMQLYNIDIASEFFVMAATLVYIKSKKLLPNVQPDDEEILEEQELLEKLNEYRRFRYLARYLGKLKDQGSIFYPRGYIRYPLGDGKNYEMKDLMIGDLITSLRRYKGAFIKKPIPIKRREINVEEKMKFILSLLNMKKVVKFSEVVKHETLKIDRIASFLGAVELSFRQKVLLHQMELFSDIDIESRGDIGLVDV